MSMRERLERKLELYGSTVTLGGRSMRAFLQDVTGGQMGMYLDYAEQSQMILPALHMVIAGSETAALDETMTLDGRTYAVRKVIPQRLGGETVCRIVILY